MEQIQQDPEYQRMIQDPQFQKMIAPDAKEGTNIQQQLQQGSKMMKARTDYMACIEKKAGAGILQKIITNAQTDEAIQYRDQLNANLEKLCAAGKREAAKRYSDKAGDAYAKHRFGKAVGAALTQCSSETGFDKVMPNPCDSRQQPLQ